MFQGGLEKLHKTEELDTNVPKMNEAYYKQGISEQSG